MPKPCYTFTPLNRSENAQMEASFKEAEAFHGFMPNYVLSMARLPMAVEAYTKFCAELYDEVTLPASLAHLVSLQASVVSGCRYSMAHAAVNAHNAGVGVEKLSDMPAFASSALFDSREQTALEFATKSATAPCPLDQPDFDEMAKFFSETEICEILFIVAQTGFHNRWNDAVSTELEPVPESLALQIQWLRAD